MINLFAYSNSDGYFYYTNYNKVFLLTPPFESVKSIGLDKSVVRYKLADAGYHAIDRSFDNIELLREFASNEYLRGNEEYFDYANDIIDNELLKYADKEIIEHYFADISDLLSQNNLEHADIIITQLMNNDLLVNDNTLRLLFYDLKVQYYKLKCKNLNVKRLGNTSNEIPHEEPEWLKLIRWGQEPLELDKVA